MGGDSGADLDMVDTEHLAFDGRLAVIDFLRAPQRGIHLPGKLRCQRQLTDVVQQADGEGLLLVDPQRLGQAAAGQCHRDAVAPEAVEGKRRAAAGVELLRQRGRRQQVGQGAPAQQLHRVADGADPTWHAVERGVGQTQHAGDQRLVATDQLAAVVDAGVVLTQRGKCVQCCLRQRGQAGDLLCQRLAVDAVGRHGVALIVASRMARPPPGVRGSARSGVAADGSGPGAGLRERGG